MACKIKKTKEFLKNVLAIQNYLESEWGIKSAQKFQAVLDAKINSLSLHPKAGTTVRKNKNIRKFSITKHNRIYYKIEGSNVIILTLFETKTNPKRNKYE